MISRSAAWATHNALRDRLFEGTSDGGLELRHAPLTGVVFEQPVIHPSHGQLIGT